MRTVLKIALCLIVFSMLASCASVPLANSEQDAAGKEFLPSQDKAILYLVRPSGMVGFAINISPVVDRQFVGTLKVGTYAMVEVGSGKHTVSMVGTGFGSCDAVEFEAKAGHLYFFKVYPKMGMFIPGLDVQQLNEEKGKKLIKKSKLVVSA